MKPAPFRYVRPERLETALTTLAEHADEAKILAGGQSLIPMMNFRLARPAVLVDLQRVPRLDAVEATADGVRIGAMARQADIRRADVVGSELPLLVEALGHVGHHQIRTRGTIGGSIAHADPAAELPAVALALGARFDVSGSDGERTIEARDFFEGPYTTALADDEILTSIHFPSRNVEAWAFEEMTRTRGDFAVAGVVAVRGSDGTQLVGFGLGWKPQRLAAAEAALAATGAEDRRRGASAAAAAEVEPVSDTHADAAYRRNAIATLVDRCLVRMAT